LKQAFIIISLISLTIFFSPLIADAALTFNPTEGIEDIVSFGDVINLSELKEHFGEVTRMAELGVDIDGNAIKIYNFASGFGCLTVTDRIVQISVSSDKINLNSGLKIGNNVEDIRDEYGNIFATSGDPKFGTGMIIYNLQPDHILSFNVDIEGKCYGIMSADCALIYKLSPSSEILDFWNAPFELEKPEVNDNKSLVVINDSSMLDGNYMTIKGEILNNSITEKRYVQIVATLYDRSGQVVDTVSSYVSSVHINPGSIAQFTIISSKGALAENYRLAVNCQ